MNSRLAVGLSLIIVLAAALSAAAATTTGQKKELNAIKTEVNKTTSLIKSKRNAPNARICSMCRGEVRRQNGRDEIRALRCSFWSFRDSRVPSHRAPFKKMFTVCAARPSALAKTSVQSTFS